MKKTARILVIALLASLLNTVVAVLPVQAEAGKLTEYFTTDSLNNANSWVSASSGAFGAHPCLTALNDSNPAISLSQSTTLPGCSNNPDTNGTGALYLTSNDNQQAGTMLYNQALPTAGGLNISFYQAQYGGTGADGISFFVKDGTKTDLTVGRPGGNLGYKGIPGALFAVGFDSYGNWMNQGYGDSACTNDTVNAANILGGVPKALAIRGPDTSVGKNGTSGFCILKNGYLGADGAIGADYFGTGTDTRASAARPVRIIVDPSTNSNPKIYVYMWKSGSLTQDVSTAPIALIVNQPADYIAAGTIKFGFSSSTGGAKDTHAIWGLEIAPLVSASSPTVYVVPNNTTVQAGQAAVYTYKFYSNLAKTVEIDAATLSYTADMCTSTYTLSTNYPASLPITCAGTVSLYNTITTDTATLSVVRGTPSIAPATNTITGNSGTAITTTAAYTARNFAAPQDLGYTISSGLPTGLSFNASTGVISGTPTETKSATYTVTARSLLETATATVTITIGAPLTYAYSITYDKGTGTAGTLASQTGTSASVTLSAFSTSTIVNPGYTFSGWLGSNSISYTDAQVLTLTGALTVTLTAQWTANPTRTVTYNAGTGTGTVPTQGATREGATFNVATGVGLTNPGYTFAGWKDSGNTAYAAGATYTVAGSSITLTAQWTANDLRTVTYNAGTGTGTVPTQIAIGEGATFTVAVGTALTNPGYTFAGWKDTGNTAYAAGATYTVAAIAVVLTAQWTANPSRTVTYNAGTGTGTVPNQLTVLQGATFIVAAGTGLSNPGFTFAGWKDSNNIDVAAASIVTVAGINIVLTAQWSTNSSRTVTYNAGTGTGTVPVQPNVLEGATFTVAPGTGLTNPGFTFAGWKEVPITLYAANSIFTVAGINVVLTAQWTANSSRTVTYNAGTGTGTVPVQLNVLEGATFIVAVGIGLTNPGYTFSGWKDTSNTPYAAASIFTVAAVNVVLTAQWTANPLRSVTYSVGTGTGTVPTQLAVLQGATFIVATGMGLTKPGYTFSGWKDIDNVDVVASSIFTAALINVVLTAQWITTSQSVTYAANGATGAVPTQATVATAATFVVAAGSTLTKAGYTFSGWKDISGVDYAAGTTFTMGVGNVILTAQWSATSQSVTYLANTATGTAPIQANVATAGTFIVAAGTALTKPGYTFAGWKDANGVDYAAGAIFTMGITSVTFTAQWTANALRGITYAANGATGTVPTQVDVLQGATFTVAVGTALTKPGYTFAGWKDAAGIDFAAAAIYTVAATNVVLTAQWSATSQSVTYAANGATGTVPTQANVATAATFSAAAGSTLTKSGSTFTGWKDAGGVDYVAGSTFTMGLINVTLTAQWLISTFAYAISYEANGGTGTMAGQTGLATSVTLSTNTFTRTGYTFAGWKDDASVAYTNAQIVPLTATTSLAMHAQWTQNLFPYAISFDSNGGTGAMSGQTGIGASVKLSANTFARTGYTFTGWKDDASVAYTDGQSTTLNATTTLALHAQWLQDKTVPPVDTPAVQTDKIISINPVTGYANDQITITGEFNHVITSISVGGLLLPANSWTQSKTTVIFMAPGHDVGKVEIKLVNGLTPLLDTQQFEYLALTKLKIGIDGIKCLGTFDKACSLKPGAVQPVSFQLASNVLSAKSIKTLKSWKLQNAKQVIIYGYASPEGSKALNAKLTKKRAAEVGAWVKKNWPNLSIKTVGLGTTVNRLCKPFKNRCAMIKIVTIKK